MSHTTVSPASVSIKRRASGRRATAQGVDRVTGLTPTERIKVIRQGLPAKLVVQIGGNMGWSQEHVMRLFGLKRSTVRAKIRKDAPLDIPDSERLLALMDMINDVREMVARSGEPEGFDASKWLAGWLEAPNPALGGSTPSELLDTHEGAQVVRRLISQMETGAYA